MDIGSLFLILALLVLVGFFVSRPFFETKATAVTQEEHDISALLAEKERTITALIELETDFTLGKIPEDEYPVQRKLLLQQGADVLQRLDALQGQSISQAAENHLDAAVAARRLAGAEATAGAGNGNGIHPDDPVEALIASRRRNRQGKAAGFCYKCGRPLQQSDRFCPKCGTAIEVERQESRLG
jgi:hypothetical protein